MVFNPVMSSLIRQGKNNSSIRDYIRSAKNGSVHIIDNVVWHIQEKRITLKECEEYLTNEDIEVIKNILDNTSLYDFKIRKGDKLNGSRRF